MKVIALGCAGHVGACFVRELVKRSPDLEVIIADNDIEAANNLASKVCGKTSVKAVDANEHTQLVGVMEGSDIVVSTLGPYYVFGQKALRAAIEAKVDFIDVDDDWDSTEDCLKLDEEARKADIIAIIGLGATPGITNLMAKYGANKLNRVDDIHTSWAWTAIDPKATEAQAIGQHYFHAITGDIPTYRGGKWVNIPALSEPETVEFVPPIGRFGVSMVGHPEPITLPRYIEGVQNVCNKGGIWPESINEMAVLDMVNITREIQIGDTRRTLGAILNEYQQAMFLNEVVTKYGEFGIEGVVLRVEVKGEQQGKSVRYSYGCGAPADFITAFPAVVGAWMVLGSHLKEKGVFAPEGIIEPKDFFRELIKEIVVDETRVEPISV